MLHLHWASSEALVFFCPNIRDKEWNIFTLLGNQFAGILKGITKTDGSLQQFLEY